MINNRDINCFSKILIGILATLIIVGCGSHDTGRDWDSIYPTTIPVNEFIIGKWEAVNPNKDSHTFEAEFLKTNTLKFAVLNEDKRILDGATSDYYFISDNTIFVDNIRITGGEIWELERDGQELLVYRTIGNSTTIIRFRRISE
jgi:hypothetical protein